MGEDAAAQYLKRSLGWAILQRNWRCEAGELDIVARDGRTLVVVEVRTRSALNCDDALASVDRRKQRRLRRLAAWYLKGEGLTETQGVRVDVIGIAWKNGRMQDLVHVRCVDFFT